MDFKRLETIDQDDSCVLSNGTDHLLNRTLAHPIDKPVSLWRKCKTPHGEAPSHAIATLCCQAMNAIAALYSALCKRIFRRLVATVSASRLLCG